MSTRQETLNELFAWIHKAGTHFTHRLFDLIAKADSSNRAKLARAYPEHVDLFREWQDGTEYEVFFRHRSSLYPMYQAQLDRILASRQLQSAYEKSVPQVTLQESVKRGWH